MIAAVGKKEIERQQQQELCFGFYYYFVPSFSNDIVYLLSKQTHGSNIRTYGTC